MKTIRLGSTKISDINRMFKSETACQKIKMLSLYPDKIVFDSAMRNILCRLIEKCKNISRTLRICRFEK